MGVKYAVAFAHAHVRLYLPASRADRYSSVEANHGEVGRLPEFLLMDHLPCNFRCLLLEF